IDAVRVILLVTMKPPVGDPTPPVRIDMDASTVVVRVPLKVTTVANNGVRFLVEGSSLPPTTPKNGEAICIVLVSWRVLFANLAFKNLVEKRMKPASGCAPISVTNLGHGRIR